MSVSDSQNNKRRKNKTLGLLFITGLTLMTLIFGSYAWFIGTGSAIVNNFSVSVAAGENLELSLDGSNWNSTLTINETAISTGSYTGNTNHWAGENGLLPVSTDGTIDTAVSRLKMYNKSSLTTTEGGFRLLTARINNYGEGSGSIVDESDDYVTFDLFVKNGSDVAYIEEYSELDDEAIYLTADSSVVAEPAGSKDYGLANSVRVAFMQIGRVASTTSDASTITSINCTSNSGSTTSLCNEGPEGTTGIGYTWNIWEPNDTKHDSELISYFSKVCKKKTVTDTTVTYDSETPCDAISDGTATDTYVVNNTISAADHVDVYDGLNGYTIPSEYPLTKLNTYTDTIKGGANDNRSEIFYLAANSITKIRVYIYLEGQDVDNYDLISLGEKITVNFGFTKDKYNLQKSITS